MKEMSTEEIAICAKLAGIKIPEDLLIQVAHNINGTLKVLDSVQISGLESVESLPIIIKH
ncbi:MAG TPA: hypothetical protein DEZ08_00450 [Dehalococcoidia bacterium]|jgi:hypothetical protein|nr:hypothetical protein [Dehalococcoidia bacterium]|tara:strand:- start:347 stop:526 length:180 start_codon:yes stop_codon:yes gene_type:complete